MLLYISYSLNELIRQIHNWQWKNKERSALVKCEKVWHDLYMTDLFFPKQRNVTTHTEFTWNPIDELLEYLGTDKIEEFGKYCIWLHSHHTMNAFWSGEDRSTRKWFKDWWCNHFVSVVTSIKQGSNNCMNVFYHATLDIFKPIDFEMDLTVTLWLPWISETEEQETEAYALYKKWLEQLQQNAEFLNREYGIDEEQITSTVKPFTWNTTTTYFSEEGYMIDNEEKIKELLAVEEKVVYNTQPWWWYSKPSKSILNFNAKIDKDDFDYMNLELYEPTPSDKWMVIFKQSKKGWVALFDGFPKYLAKGWYYTLDHLSEFHELTQRDKRDYKLAWNQGSRTFYAVKYKTKKSIIDEIDDDYLDSRLYC